MYMGIGDVVILAVLFVWIGIVLAFFRKRKKQGKCISCIGCSSGCGSGACAKNERQKQKNV